MPQKTVCSKCNSERIVRLAWVDVNTREVFQDHAWNFRCLYCEEDIGKAPLKLRHVTDLHYVPTHQTREAIAKFLAAVHDRDGEALLGIFPDAESSPTPEVAQLLSGEPQRTEDQRHQALTTALDKVYEVLDES